MNAAFSCTTNPCIIKSRKSARSEVAIAIPKRRQSVNFQTELSVHGISCTDLSVHEVVQRQSRNIASPTLNLCSKPGFNPMFLEEAYDRCRDLCAEYAKTFYLGTLLMTEERQKAIWAIYVWCRRTDELVDGPNAVHLSSAVLDRWEERLDDIFNGRPYDMLDAALTDTVHKFPLDIKPFKDMIEGMRMDTRKNRYEDFQELYLYCYYVAGTVGLMSVPVMGIAPESSVSAQTIYDSALYLPQDELAKFGLSDKDVFSRKVTHGWREFMKEQIRRARFYFDQAEEGATQLDKASRWPVWSSLMLYRMILESIESNDYDNLTKRAYVGRAKKLMALPVAYTRAVSSPTAFIA